MIYANIQERLFANSVPVDCGCVINGEPSECWLWTGAVTADGYPRMSIRRNGRVMKFYAHRISHEVFVAPIPEKHDADHLPACPRHCIHPNHVAPMEYRAHRRKTGFPFKNASGSNGHLPEAKRGN